MYTYKRYAMLHKWSIREKVVWEFGDNDFKLYDIFVVNRRALSSSSVDGVCAMLNHACTVLEQEFREILYARLRLGFPSGFDFTQAYNLVQSSIQQGKLQRSDQETQKAKNAFLVSIYFVLIYWLRN